MQEEINLSELFRILRKKSIFIIIFTVICCIAAYIIIKLQPPVYKSYAMVNVGSVGGKRLELSSETDSIMSSGFIIGRIREELKQAGIEETGMVLSRIYYNYNGRLIEIVAQDRNPDIAFKCVQVITELLLERHMKIYNNKKQEFFDSVQLVKKQISPTLLSASLESIVNFVTPTMTEIPPQKGAVPILPDKRKILIIVAMLSLVISSAVSLLVESIR